MKNEWMSEWVNIALNITWNTAAWAVEKEKGPKKDETLSSSPITETFSLLTQSVKKSQVSQYILDTESCLLPFLA